MIMWVCALFLVAFCVRSARSAEYPLACELASRHQQCKVDETGSQCLPDLSDNRRLVVIGDIHGSFAGLLELLYQAKVTTSPETCSWREQGPNREDGVVLVQVGDLVDRGPDPWGAFNCLRTLQKDAHLYNSKVVRLVGNHDIWWLNGHFHDRNATTDTVPVLRQVVTTMIQDIHAGTMEMAYAHMRHEIPLLFVHAGIRPTFYKHLQKTLHPNKVNPVLSALEIALYANVQLKQDFGTCTALPCQSKKSAANQLYEAGPDRGGAGIGGPLWTDFSMLEDAAKHNKEPKHFIQVVGHTMAFCYSPRQINVHPSSHIAECSAGLVRASHKLQSVCVDGGMYLGARAYLELTKDAHFVAHERYVGDKKKVEYDTYQQRDLTKAVCKAL